jgi:DNA-binding MarR family transcriptional regulator
MATISPRLKITTNERALMAQLRRGGLDNPWRTSQELAAALRRTMTGIDRTAGSLVGKGWAERRNGPGASACYRLTTAGEAARQLAVRAATGLAGPRSPLTSPTSPALIQHHAGPRGCPGG